MSRPPLSLVIATPLSVVVEADDVRSFRAADDSGGFGILPGHVGLLTVLTASVVRWQDGAGTWRYCALRGGVLRVAGGREIRIACREAVPGSDLAALEAQVRAQRAAEAQAASSARVAQARLHVRAIRQIMRHLSDRADGARPGLDGAIG